jgi:ribosomal protein L25 (general stress protein Ctc)
MIKVINEIEVLELNGERLAIAKKPTIKIISHRNYKDEIVIEIDDKKITLLAKHVEMAVRNATNSK